MAQVRAKNARPPKASASPDGAKRPKASAGPDGAKPPKASAGSADPTGAEAAPRPPLVLALNAPGMTPLLRAGLGGLAATLRSIARARDGRAPWPTPVGLGPGRALVEPTRITIEWGDRPEEQTLRALFAEAFRLDRGVIDLPGTYAELPPGRALAAALQAGLKKTFLQHGSSTKKDGQRAAPETIDLGETQVTAIVQRYASFVHQGAWQEVRRALEAGSVQLSGWAYPGAAQRHIAYGVTRWAYDAATALAACFALVGCLSFEVPRSGGGGALVVVEPADLVAFAAVRPVLTPQRLADAYITGASDGVLAVHLALKLAKVRRRDVVAGVHGITLRPTPWAKQQKNRTATVSVGEVGEALLEQYGDAAADLPASIRVAKGKKGGDDGDDEGAGYFVLPSALRGLITENLAHGRRWFEGFATATTAEKRPRFLHYYRKSDNLGALLPDEKKGLIHMTERLDDAEKALVRSVHEAVRARLSAIAKDTKDNPVARQNRWKGERERLRLAFAGAKTHEQVRAALADLWSRGGTIPELQANWARVLPLLRPAGWQAARDLALVALASYQGRPDRPEEKEPGVDESEAGEAGEANEA